ncbi:MAG: hypothetical protein EOP32_35005 [Rhodococcus sp. (in: high G+C Gram-positive bacteria)]|nr:MAG: hypothetical protein EOP32_35005 [Rhodococcus sp. (in: high G+C Gram-positive bacteria)]
MSTETDASLARQRITIYITIAVIFVVLLVVAVLSYHSAATTQQAEQKADQLTAELQGAGLTAPSREQIVRVLGDDGGAVCANPNEALTRATLAAQLANGSGGPGTRPIITDSRLLQGQLLVIKTYCPDELADFQQFVDDLETARVAEI